MSRFQTVIQSDKLKIALVTGWWVENRRSATEATLKLLNILEPLSSQMSWVVTNQQVEDFPIGDTSVINIRSKHVKGALPKVIVYYLLYQIRVILAMLRLIIHSKVDVFFFAFGSDESLLPVLFGRLAGKKVIIRSDERPSYSPITSSSKLSKIRVALYRMVEAITYSAANILAPESRCMVSAYSLQKYSNKVTVGKLYVDTHLFSNTKKLAERAYEVGCIGRLSKRKGTLEFVQSLSLMPANMQIRAIIVGELLQEDEIKDVLAKSNMQDKVDLVGWVENKKVPQYLNDIKLLVLPSYGEGLPNIVLESMACGTPVLATSVGGITDVIRDGETGFIMEDNSPECIARNLTRSLNHPELEQIAINAYTLISKDYSYEAVVDSYRKMLLSLTRKQAM